MQRRIGVVPAIMIPLLATMLVAASCDRTRRPPGGGGPRSAAIRKPRTGAAVPYGQAWRGSLWWESSSSFKRITAELRTPLRIASFRTTLPDPLPGEEHNVALTADMLAGKVIRPGEVFSMNAALGPYTRERGFREGPVYVGSQIGRTIGGGVCKIATTLYNVAILAGLGIVERRSHGMLVPYVPPGQDATVSYGAVDIKFMNDTGSDLVLWADTRGNTLYAALYGRVPPPRVTWHHRILARRRTWTIYRRNGRLRPGESRVAIPGADGMTVKSWLAIEDPQGKSRLKELGTDYYQPMPRVIERGPPA